MKHSSPVSGGGDEELRTNESSTFQDIDERYEKTFLFEQSQYLG